MELRPYQVGRYVRVNRIFPVAMPGPSIPDALMPYYGPIVGTLSIPDWAFASLKPHHFGEYGYINLKGMSYLVSILPGKPNGA